MGLEIHTPYTLPVNDNVPGNDYAFCVELDGQPWFTSKGAMIAYYGNVRFEPLGQTSMPAIVAARFSSPLYSNDWVLAQGQGKLILGDRGFNINSYDLDDGNLTIRASNLLAFQPTLDLKQVSQQIGPTVVAVDQQPGVAKADLGRFEKAVGDVEQAEVAVSLGALGSGGVCRSQEGLQGPVLGFQLVPYLRL